MNFNIYNPMKQQKRLSHNMDGNIEAITDKAGSDEDKQDSLKNSVICDED